MRSRKAGLEGDIVLQYFRAELFELEFGDFVATACWIENEGLGAGTASFGADEGGLVLSWNPVSAWWINFCSNQCAYAFSQ